MANGQLGTTSVQSPSRVLVLRGPFYPNSPPRPAPIPHYRVHLILSSLQLTFGTLCFGLGILGRSIDSEGVDSGSGYCGVPFFMAGMFGFLATRPYSVINKKCNFFACCLTFSVISSISSIIGISLSRGERMQIRMRQDMDLGVQMATFHLVKLWIVLALCAVEFLISIVHSGFVCASCCDQCVKREVPPPAPILSTETTQPQAVAGTSGTSPTYPMLVPQATSVAVPKTTHPTAPPTYEETFPYEGPPLEDFDEFPRRMSP